MHLQQLPLPVIGGYLWRALQITPASIKAEEGEIESWVIIAGPANPGGGHVIIIRAVQSADKIPAVRPKWDNFTPKFPLLIGKFLAHVFPQFVVLNNAGDL